MGVRFACHACGKRLNIKTELAGRRGICPSCSVRFRIPTHDTETSTPVHSSGIHSSGVRDSFDPEDSSAVRDDSESSDAVFTAGEDASTQSKKAAASATGTVTPTAPASSQPRSVTSTPIEPAKKNATAITATAPTRTLAEVLGDRTATWYVRPPGGGQYGPADGPTLEEWIHEGRVSDTAMLWRDGWPDWRSAQHVLPISRAPQAPVVSEQVAPPSDPDVALRTGKKVLPTNKNKVSRKRVTISVMLACILVVLAVALILVLNQSA